jgi:hypothetical protein
MSKNIVYPGSIDQILLFEGNRMASCIIQGRSLLASMVSSIVFCLYKPMPPRVSKAVDPGEVEQIASDFFSYVNDIRICGFTKEHYWKVAQKVASHNANIWEYNKTCLERGEHQVKPWVHGQDQTW